MTDDELRKRAEALKAAIVAEVAATEKDRVVQCDCAHCSVDCPQAVALRAVELAKAVSTEAESAYRAAATPDTVLALLDRLAKVREILRCDDIDDPSHDDLCDITQRAWLAAGWKETT